MKGWGGAGRRSGKTSTALLVLASAPPSHLKSYHSCTSPRIFYYQSPVAPRRLGELLFHLVAERS